MASQSQQSADTKVYEPQANTLVVYNFDPKATLFSLVERITLAGPFGALYNAQLHSKSPVDYSEFQGPCLFLTFTTLKASAHLLAFIRHHGTFPETDSPEDEGRPICSRVVIIKGDDPKSRVFGSISWGNTLFGRWLRHHAIHPGDVVAGGSGGMKIDGEQAQVWVLNSHASAKLLMEYITTRPGETSADIPLPGNGLEVSYGRYPLEFGVKHSLGACGLIAIDWKNFQWELPNKDHNSNVGAISVL
ncbi:hypothetical protein V8F33_005978 [Rhypophila sp. PSN 637]